MLDQIAALAIRDRYVAGLLNDLPHKANIFFGFAPDKSVNIIILSPELLLQLSNCGVNWQTQTLGKQWLLKTSPEFFTNTYYMGKTIN